MTEPNSQEEAALKRVIAPGLSQDEIYWQLGVYRPWQILLTLPDNREYLAWQGTDQRALLGLIDALTRQGVNNSGRLIISVGNGGGPPKTVATDV